MNLGLRSFFIEILLSSQGIKNYSHEEICNFSSFNVVRCVQY